MSGNSFDCLGGAVEEVAALFFPHAGGAVELSTLIEQLKSILAAGKKVSHLSSESQPKNQNEEQVIDANCRDGGANQLTGILLLIILERTRSDRSWGVQDEKSNTLSINNSCFWPGHGHRL